MYEASVAERKRKGRVANSMSYNVELVNRREANRT